MDSHAMRYKAVGFDVDGTLVSNIEYCWETFHERFGVSERVRSSLKSRYFAGRITYKQWGAKEVAIWRALGISRGDFTKVIESLRLVDGAVETLSLLKRSGLFLFILSGTVRIILEQLLPDYASLFDRAAVSDIVFDGERCYAEKTVDRSIHSVLGGGEAEIAVEGNKYPSYVLTGQVK